MHIKASVGRASKSACTDNYVASLQLRESLPADPFVLVAIARALTGKAPELWEAIHDEAERCVADQRAEDEARLVLKLAAGTNSKSAVRAAIRRVGEDQHQLTKPLAARLKAAKSVDEDQVQLVKKQVAKLKACLAAKHVRSKSKKPTRRRST